MNINNEILGRLLESIVKDFDHKTHYVQDNKCYFNGVAVGDITYKVDEKNRMIDIFYHPYQEIKSIYIDFTITKSGIEFNEK